MEPFGQKMESSGAQTAPPRLILVGGGVKSGKSAFALRLAADLAACGGGPTAPKVFIATGYAGDDEMARRIARHRQERGEAFTTLELPPKQPRTLPEILAGLDQTLPGNAKPTVAVVDCLTLWLSALLLEGESADAIALHVERLAAAAERRRGATVVVTNEVGMGVVPESPLGREFRDVAGAAHQMLAARADRVYFAAMGLMVCLKPEVTLAGPLFPSSGA